MKSVPLRLRRFCAFITGVVFFLSGIFKLLDPVGASLVMSDYYRFFHVGFLDFSALPAALLLALAETVIGAALVSGVWRKPTALAASAFLAFFTLLTLVLVIFNPEMDCGCFGEVVHLTHLQTFLKNVVLCILAFIAFFPYRDFGHTRRRKYVAFPMVLVCILAFAGYSLIYIPLADYTDFKPASRLSVAETHRDGGEDMYDYVLVYEKDGKTAEFSLDNLPDSTWNFVDSKAVLRAGAEEEVFPELSFYDASGIYCDSLATGEKVMVLSLYAPERAGKAKWESLAAFVMDAGMSGFRPLLMVASYPEKLSEILRAKGVSDDISEFIMEKSYYSDYKTLVSMNRSNGGVTYFDKGYLIRKWAYAGLPDKERMEELYSGDVTETLLEYNTFGKIVFDGILLYCFAVMLLL